GQPRPWALPRQYEALAGPLLIGFVQQRQIEQPLARIIDDVERQRPVRAILPLVFDDKSQLADVDGRVRPAALCDETAKMVLVVEPRHRIVGLRLKPCPRDPASCKWLENGKAPATRQPMDQRGNKDRF